MAGHNRTSLTEQQKAAIKEMATKGDSNGAIARAINIKRSTVGHVAKLVRGGAPPPPEGQPGRPRALSERDLRSLSRLMKANRFSCLSTITSLVHVGRPEPVSSRTVRYSARNRVSA